MLLSIGMIVKNEEKYLKRCLEALSPILEQVPSELIITDTGSTDKTVDIARQYTDNVLHFDWCDDFAAARNTTLKRARGKWYLYIDADEIIEDCSDIIRFFCSGEYKDYNAASIIVKSFNDQQQKVTGSIRLARLVKITKGLEFVNPIHERLNALGQPVKELHTIVNHYGYVIENNEEFIRNKMERNLKIMLSEEKKNPSDCSNLLNIVQAYAVMGNMEAALAYCDKGLSYAKKQKSFHVHLFHARKTKIYYNMQDFKNVLSCAGAYFKSKNTPLILDIEIYVYQAKCYTLQNDYKQAMEAYKSYVRLLREYNKGLLHTPDQYYGTVNYTDAYSYYDNVLDLIDLLIVTQDFKQAEKYSRELEIGSLESDGELITRKLTQDLQIMSATGDFTRLPVLYSCLSEDYKRTLRLKIEELMADENLDGIVLKAFYEAAAEETPYVAYMKLRHLYSTGSLAARDVEAVLEALETVSEPYADLVYLTFYSGASLRLLSSKLSPYDFAETTYSDTRCSRQWPRYALSSFDGTAESFEAERHLWISILHERALLSDDIGNELKPALFYEYGRHYSKYMKRLLNAETLREENAGLLPRPLRTGLFCSLAAKYKAEGKMKEYVQALRRILKSDPRFTPLVQLLTDELSDSGENRQPDFDEYARMVKKNIAYLCEINETEKARGLLAAYEQLNPDDEELAALKARLDSRS